MLFALAVLIAAGAAALGEIDSAPIGLVAGAAALAAVISQLLPNVQGAMRKRRARANEERRAAVQLSGHLDAVQRRFREHMASSNPFGPQAQAAGFMDRLVRRRGESADRGDLTTVAELVLSLTDPDNDSNRLLLLGEGGVGKTTSLLRLASEAAARARDDALAPIPVYVELSRFDASERGFSQLYEMAAHAMLGVDKTGFDRHWWEGTRPLLFLLDGLNEQRGKAATCVAGVRELAARTPHLCVVTSRSTVEADELTATDDGFRIAELLRLDPAQIERFLGDHGLGRLHEEMSDALKELTRNPFMLMALVRTTAGRPEAALPRNVGELYRSFVDDYVYARREPGRGHVRYAYDAVKKPLLAALAARMTAGGRTVEPSGPPSDAFVTQQLAAAWADGDGRESMPDPWGPKGFRGEVVANGILRPTEGGVEFMHQSVQEYFTAVALENEPVDAVVKRIRPLIWRHVDFGRHDDAGPEDPYRVPVTMLSGLRPSSDDLVTALASRHPVLAAECVGAATSIAPGTVARLQDEWLALLGRAHGRYRSVGAQCLGAARMSGGAVIPRLMDLAIDDPEFAIQEHATAALDRLGTRGGEDHLAAKVQRPGRYDTATTLLIARAPRRAVRVLLEHWVATESPVRRTDVEEALRLVDRGTALDVLIGILSQDNGPIGEAARTLLQRMDSAPKDPAFITEAVTSAANLTKLVRARRKQADARVAGKSSGELIELLSDPDAFTRGAAARALAVIGRTDAVPMVIEALTKESSSSNNVDEMARTARQLGEAKAAASLLERARGPDTVLLMTLPGPWPSDLAPGAVPEAVSKALQAAGIGRPEEAVGGHGRWKLLSDVVVEDRDGHLTVLRTGVRVKVLSAAALITPKGLSASALIALLDHDDAAVRAKALELLSEGADGTVTEPVARLLERETVEPVIAAAALALARAGTADARTILVDLVARGASADGWIGSALARLEQPEKVDGLLCDRAGSGQGEARTALLRALAFVRRRQVTLASGDPAVHDRSRAMLVEAALADTGDEARRAAAAALRWSAGDPGTTALVDALAAIEPVRRARAARALGVLQDDSASHALAQALGREKDLAARVEIAAALGELRADDALSAAARVLVDLILSDEDVALRRSALVALGRARQSVSGNPIVERLVALSDSGHDDKVEAAVGRYLECLDEMDFVGALSLWLRGMSRARRGFHAGALSDYDTALEHEDIAAVQKYRADALAALGRPADALTAQRLAVDGDPDDAGNHALLGRYAYEAGELDVSIAARLQAIELAKALPDDERHAVLDVVRQDLDALRAGLPESASAAHARLRTLSEALGEH